MEPGLILIPSRAASWPRGEECDLMPTSVEIDFRSMPDGELR
jgi:hypothetical protein